MLQYQVLDEHGGPVVHIAELRGPKGAVFHLKIAGDAMSAHLIELNEKIIGDNRNDLIEKAVGRLRGSSYVAAYNAACATSYNRKGQDAPTR
jgi:hypothetical protein